MYYTHTGLIRWYNNLINLNKKILTCGRLGNNRPVSGSRHALEICVSQMDASMASVWCESVSMEMRLPAGRRRRQRFLTPIFIYCLVWCFGNSELMGNATILCDEVLERLRGGAIYYNSSVESNSNRQRGCDEMLPTPHLSFSV